MQDVNIFTSVQHYSKDDLSSIPKRKNRGVHRYVFKINDVRKKYKNLFFSLNIYMPIYLTEKNRLV